MYRSLRTFGVLLALCWAAKSASALAPGLGGPKTTLVIITDRPMADSLWTVLFAELRKEAAAEARSLSALDADPQLVKGADVVPGQLMDNPIVVKLHGDCRPPAGLRAFPSSAPLGWVRREEGRISSFIQVDCTHVAELISQRVLWMSNLQKAAAMSGAIARVILHEWIHIAEQSDRHTRNGISKPVFGSNDLLFGFDSEMSSSEASHRTDKPSAKSEPE